MVLLTLLNIIYNVSSKSYNFFAASDWKEIVTHPDDLDKIVLADLFSMEIQEEQAPESEPAPSLETTREAQSELPPEKDALAETSPEEAPAETPKSMIEPPRFQGQDYAAFGESYESISLNDSHSARLTFLRFVDQMVRKSNLYF